jgi:hypothetical protein
MGSIYGSLDHMQLKIDRQASSDATMSLYPGHKRYWNEQEVSNWRTFYST